MPLLFLAVVIGIPVLEIYVFVEVGSQLGGLNTVILTILTAIAGMALLRYQGLSVLMQAQTTLQKGESPVTEILNGILLAVAGLFLLIPGFVTDGVGFLLFLPPLRNLIAGWMAKNSRMRGFHTHTHSHSRGPYGRSGSSTVIDGEFSVVEDEENAEILEIEPGGPSDPDSPWSKNGDKGKD